MNKFEKYLLDNKEHLEPDKVNPRVWLAIENEVLKEKNKSYRKVVKLSIIVFLALTGLGMLYILNQKDKPLDEEKILADLNLSQYNFTKQVDLKKEQLSKAMVPQDKLEDFQILLQQLEFMDGQFQDYKQYIEDNGYQNFIGEQILNFYKSKIELLDRIQEEIEKINYYESKEPSISKKVGIQI